MRKNRLKSILLAVLMLVPIFGSCSKQEEAVQETTGKTLMNGFEYYDRDISLIRLINEFGRLEENTDKQFIHSGEKSLKITPRGSRIHTANPYFVLPTSSLRFTELAYSDFSKVDNISFWFYNNEAQNVNVGIGFTQGLLRMDTDTRREHINKTAVEYFTLKKGWNYVEYKIRPMYLALQNVKLEEIYGVVVEFDHIISNKLGTSAEIYLDDVVLTYTDEERSSDFTMEVEKGKTADGNDYWQLSDFENPLETYYYSYYYSYPAPREGYPIVKTVSSGDYNAVMTKGTSALLIQKKWGTNRGGSGWPSLMLHKEVIKAVFAEIGDDIKNNPQNYALKWDVYNDSDVKDTLNIRFEGDKSVPAINTVTVGSKQWNSYSATISSINKAIVKEGYKPFSEDPGFLFFFWYSYTTEAKDDRPFLVDNLRIEKIS